MLAALVSVTLVRSPMDNVQEAMAAETLTLARVLTTIVQAARNGACNLGRLA